MSDWFVDALREMSGEWNKAESAIKIAEQVNRKVVDPAIYELRYAGRKIIEAAELRDSDEQKARALLLDAKIDCLRARHDAVDAATSKMIVDLDIAVHKLGATRVLSAFPDWSNAYEQLSKVKAKIAYSREDRNNREKIYATIEAIDLPSVVNLYDRYKALEPQLVSEARSGRLKEWLIPAILTVVGIIGGVLGTKFFG